MNAAIMSGLGSISDIAKQISAKKEQSDYRASANVGDPFFKPGVERIKPPQRTDSASYGRRPGESGSTFSKSSCDAGNKMFGNQQQRDMSMPIRNSSIEGPLFMKDQTGDGKITQADVIKARVEGYKGSPATMHKGKPHPGEYFIAPPSASRPMKPTKREQKNIIMEDYRGKMRQRNDSLRKLKPTDKHYLPTFDKGTDDKVNFYKDPKNKPKINALIKLSKPLRDKTQKKLRNI